MVICEHQMPVFSMLSSDKEHGEGNIRVMNLYHKGHITNQWSKKKQQDLDIID